MNVVPTVQDLVTIIFNGLTFIVLAVIICSSYLDALSQNLVRNNLKNQQGGKEKVSALCTSVISMAEKQSTESTRGGESCGI